MPASHTHSHKLSAINAVNAILTAHPTTPVRAACREAGVKHGNFVRWSQRLAAGGQDALLPDYSRCGRPPKVVLSDDERTALRQLVLIRDSKTFAVEEFAKEHPACRPETRELLLAEIGVALRERRYPRWPASVRNVIGVTRESQALFRGERFFQNLGFSPRKGLFFEDEDGRQIPLLPHLVWVADDYSANQPYVVWVSKALGCDMVEAQRLCRQVLCWMDVASAAWLSVDLIGRERDAYRGEDITRSLLRTIEGQGTMPQYIMLEQGAWKSAAVHGLDLGKSWDQGGLGPRYEGRRWGALDDLFTILHGYSSRFKAVIESSFNLLQRALAHSGTDIGRTRGEFERATRDMLAVQGQAALIFDGGTPRRWIDAEAKGFLSLIESRDVHWAAMQYLNNRGRHRTATGTVEVPNELLGMFDDAMRRPLPERERWRFLPIKRRATVGGARNGFVQISVEPYPRPFLFQVNGNPDGSHLPSGYTVLVAFDPAMPALGAYIANGEDGDLNPGRMPIGQYIMTAPHAEDAPLFSLRPGGYGNSAKRRASASARTAFAAINPNARGLTVDAEHDGEGLATVRQRGGRRPALPAAAGASTHRAQDPVQVPRVSAEQLAELERAALEDLAAL